MLLQFYLSQIVVISPDPTKINESHSECKEAFLKKQKLTPIQNST